MNPDLNQEAAEFKKLLQNGLLPTVKDLTDYKTKADEGVVLVRAYLKENPILEMPKEVLAGIHQMIFREVYPSAGRLRTKPQETAWIAGRPGVDPQRNLKELDLLNEQFRQLLQGANTPEKKMGAVAFYHARLILIQPFTDGNKRVSREVLDSQLNALFGSKKRLSLDEGMYREAVTSVLRETDMTRMVRFLLFREGISVEKAAESVPEFRLAPLLYQEEFKDATLQEDLARTIKPRQEQARKGMKF